MHHDHSHHHTHGSSGHHHHSHSHDVASNLTFEEKMIKLLEHWIKHNEDHAGTYADWAIKAEKEGFEVVGNLLNEATRVTRTVTTSFEAALAELKKEQ